MQPASEHLHFQPTGASFYAEGEWVEAAEAYGEAATALQVNDLPVALRRPALDLIIACWLNQAQCQLQLQAWAKAEELCDRVLQREPSHAKALYRRGAALMQQGEATRARADLRVAYRAAPTDRGVRQLLDECERTVREEARQERAYTSRMFAAPPKVAIAEPAGGGARDHAGGAVWVGWAGGSRAAAWRRALVAPWGLVGSLLGSCPGLTHAMALLGIVVVAPLVLSAVVLAALGYFI
jgi:tetratricopeptide (TPR) repeat protein